VIGKLVAISGSGGLRIDIATGAPQDFTAARTVVPLTEADVGRDLAIMFEAGDTHKPLVLGLIQHPAVEQPLSPKRAVATGPVPFVLEADGQRLVVTAQREIVIRCGEASITLTRAGKILIRGNYLLSRSEGVNKIKGGSIQLN